jgi:hypothetical protein
MSLYVCSTCSAVDNTATGPYWQTQPIPLCAECHTGEWHGKFPRQQYQPETHGVMDVATRIVRQGVQPRADYNRRDWA